MVLILKTTGTVGSPCGIWNPRHMRSNSIAPMMIMAIIRIEPIIGEPARSGSGCGDNILSYIK
jgi:hypothetical protein